LKTAGRVFFRKRLTKSIQGFILLVTGRFAGIGEAAPNQHSW
jgi:hypothetical protein